MAAAVFPRASAASAKSPPRRPGGAPPTAAAHPSLPAGPVLRTVLLPTAQADALTLKCEALQAQLAEQRQFAEERVAALLEDRAIRERDTAAQLQVCSPSRHCGKGGVGRVVCCPNAS